MFELSSHFLIHFLLAIFSAIILNLYCGIFFDARKKSTITLIVCLIFISWQFYLSSLNRLPPYINIFINFFLICLTCSIGYKGNRIQKFIFSLLLVALWMLTELLVGYLFNLAGFDYKQPVFWGSIISKILILILILALKKYFQNEHISNLSMKHTLELMLISIGGMYILYNIFMLTNENKLSDKYVFTGIVSAFIILGVNLLTYQLYLNLSKEKEIQRLNTVYEQQIELYSQQMREKEHFLTTFRKERHDLKQHYSILYSMLSCGSTTEALEYIKKLTKETTLKQTYICNTDNLVVDSIINFKYSEAINKNIQFSVQIFIPMNLPFKNADLGILLGNILDNAIECTELLPESKRKIDFYMRYEKNILIITEKNEYMENLIQSKEGTLLSNKKDATNHGIGLLSVKKIAEKYHGSVVIDTSNFIFKIKILLCAY